jgi:predicted nucleic acid-binding protein
LILDSGALSRLAERRTAAVALQRALRRAGLWPPLVPSVVLVECLTGTNRDASTNRFLKACDVVATVPESLARRAGTLRHRARRGSAVDALLVATAQPGDVVLTSDDDDLVALAAHAEGVLVRVC